MPVCLAGLPLLVNHWSSFNYARQVTGDIQCNTINEPEPGSIPFLQFNSNSNSDNSNSNSIPNPVKKSLRQFNSNSNSDDGNSNSIPSPMLSIPFNSVLHIDRTKLNLH